MWQENSNPYGAASSSSAQGSSSYYGSPPPQHLSSHQPASTAPSLQFYSGGGGVDQNAFYTGAQGNMGMGGGGNAGVGGGVHGSMNAGMASYGGNIQTPGGWWTAFGTGGVEGEPPLLEELGINFGHIRMKSMTVLNPLARVDEHIMDDADMAGPIIYCFCFATFLLLSGKPQFSYIYGVALLGSASIYLLLNLMAATGMGAYRIASVLGYCLLPMVGVSALSVVLALDGTIGYILSILSILWCTWSASAIFVACLRMSDQRLLVAYPIGLLYGCFALLSVFNVGAGGNGK